MKRNGPAHWALGAVIVLAILFVRELTGVAYLGITHRSPTPIGDIDWADLLLSWLLAMGLLVALGLPGYFLNRRIKDRRRRDRSQSATDRR